MDTYKLKEMPNREHYTRPMLERLESRELDVICCVAIGLALRIEDIVNGPWVGFGHPGEEDRPYITPPSLSSNPAHVSWLLEALADKEFKSWHGGTMPGAGVRWCDGVQEFVAGPIGFGGVVRWGKGKDPALALCRFIAVAWKYGDLNSTPKDHKP